MNERPETEDMEQFQKVIELIPPYRGYIHPPLSLVARGWALIDVSASEEGYVYTESHQEGDKSHTVWTIVVADSTHLVHVRAAVPFPGWAQCHVA